MSIDTLFSKTTKLKNFKLYLDNYEIPMDDILDVTISNSLLSFGMNALIVFRDSNSLLNSKKITLDEKLTITFEVNDRFDSYEKFLFKISNTSVTSEESRTTFISIQAIDPITYAMKNLYLAKSFNTDMCSAFREIFSNYKYNEELSKLGLKLDLVKCNKVQHFTWTSNKNAYDFFKEYGRLSNVRMWYDFNNLHVKEFDLQKEQAKYPLKCKSGEVEYTDTCYNTNYAFRIHQYKKGGLNHQQLMELTPAQEVIRFKGKSVNRETVNLNDFYSSLVLNGNNDFSTFQNTSGKRSNIRVDSVEAQKYDLFDAFMHLNTLNIIVPGSLKYNCAGYIVNVKLGEKTPYRKQQLKGDNTASGKYLILGTESRFIKGHFHQLLMLGRFDKPKSY